MRTLCTSIAAATLSSVLLLAWPADARAQQQGNPYVANVYSAPVYTYYSYPGYAYSSYGAQQYTYYPPAYTVQAYWGNGGYSAPAYNGAAYAGFPVYNQAYTGFQFPGSISTEYAPAYGGVIHYPGNVNYYFYTMYPYFSR